MPVNKAGRPKIKLWAVVFWLILWQVMSMIIDQTVVLVSPVNVLMRLFQLVGENDFWLSIFNTTFRITMGFLAGTLAGIALASLSSRFKKVEELLAPALLAVKAVPVASFIILALILFSSRHLAVLISFLMVLPVIYSNVLEGIRACDSELLEMAEIFKLSIARKIRYIYMHQVFPYFKSACASAVGMSWKSGVAAELIGIPTFSIGEKLHDAKVYFDTPDLFAWTLVIVLLSLTFEKLFNLFLRRAEKWMGRIA